MGRGLLYVTLLSVWLVFVAAMRGNARVGTQQSVEGTTKKKEEEGGSRLDELLGRCRLDG